MSSKPLGDRVTQLEEIVSHQERLLNELNEIVVRLRAEHDELRRNTKLHVDRLEARLENSSHDHDSIDKPPHY